jgi:hypothetical protein
VPTTTDSLERFGTIPAEWIHVDKVVTPAAGLVLPHGYLKWYDVHPDGQPVDPAVQDRARAFVRAEADAGDLELQDEFGHVILHRSGSFHFLIVCVWRSVNEMWQALYLSEGDGAFGPFQHDGKALRGTQCVWELGPTAHERQAWTRYLLSDRDEAAKRAFVDDQFSGPTAMAGA